MIGAPSTQDVFLDRLVEIAENANLDIRIDKSYANIGHVHFSYPGSLKPISTLRFDFQSGGQTASFSFRPPRGPGDAESHYCKFDDGSLDTLLNHIRDDLAPEGQ